MHLRRTFLMPDYEIAAHLYLAYSTVCRYLERHGISRKRDILPPPNYADTSARTPAS